MAGTGPATTGEDGRRPPNHSPDAADPDANGFGPAMTHKARPQETAPNSRFALGRVVACRNPVPLRLVSPKHLQLVSGARGFHHSTGLGSACFGTDALARTAFFTGAAFGATAFKPGSFFFRTPGAFFTGVAATTGTGSSALTHVQAEQRRHIVGFQHFAGRRTLLRHRQDADRYRPTRSFSSTARSRNSNSGFASSRAPTPYSTAATCLHIEA